jgi:hypothetical protein
VSAVSLGEVLDSARRRGFVGRRTELETFAAALAGRSGRRVLFVHGVGGIGKTTLLLELRARARSADRVVALLDGREIDPSPEGFRAALRLTGCDQASVLLIDGYEQLGPADAWLRGELIPALPADGVVVLAGRDPPNAAWRADPGWRQVVAIHHLDHLDDADSADLLVRAGVAAPVRERLMRLGQGHPLALALLADAAATGTVPERLADVPELIGALMESLLHRYSPVTTTITTLRARGSAAVVPAQPGEHGQILSMIERYEGPASAALAEGWFADHPDGLSAVRTGDGIAGFAYHILVPSGSAMEQRDPAVRAVLDHVDRTSPLRPGERIDIVRFTGGRIGHQRDDYAVLAGSVSSIVLWCTEPLAWSFITAIDSEFWGPYFDYLGLRVLLEVEAAGSRLVCYGHDWRRFPVDAWLDLMNEREHAGGSGPPPESMLRPAPLSRTAFGAAVRAALAQPSAG